MPVSKPPYPAEFRQQMVELVEAGRTPAQLSREFKCSAQAISNWVARSRADARKPARGREVLSNRVRRQVLQGCGTSLGCREYELPTGCFAVVGNPLCGFGGSQRVAHNQARWTTLRPGAR